VDMVMKGAAVTGKMEHSGIYRSAEVTPSVTKDELMATNEEWIQEVIGRKPPPG